MKTTIVLAILFLWGGAAHAEVVITGTQVTATMTEPAINVENSDGVVTPVTDLAETWVTYELTDAVLGGMGEEMCGERIPASSLSGGGEVSTTCIVPVVPNSDSDVMFRGYAIDLSGNESDPTPDLTKRIDSLRTAAPTFYGIQ